MHMCVYVCVCVCTEAKVGRDKRKPKKRSCERENEKDANFEKESPLRRFPLFLPPRSLSRTAAVTSRTQRRVNAHRSRGRVRERESRREREREREERAGRKKKARRTHKRRNVESRFVLFFSSLLFFRLSFLRLCAAALLRQWVRVFERSGGALRDAGEKGRGGGGEEKARRA